MTPLAHPGRVAVESVLPASADAVWEAVKSTATLHEVARPLVRFRPCPGTTIPDRWPVGVPVELRLFLFGVVPLGPHTLLVESVDDTSRTLQTRERGPRLCWDHRIHVEPDGPECARYSDEVEIDAGPLTPVVAAVARLFFWYRHRRWQALARALGTGAHPS